MALAKNTDHVAQAIARLASQYAGKTNMERVARVIGQRAQVLEDVVWDLVTMRTLDGSAGQQMDDLGEILGELRNGRSDADYRVFLRTRILLNKSSGTADQILDLFALALTGIGGTYTYTLEELFDAAVLVAVHGSMAEPTAGSLANLLRQARAGGVQSVLQWSGFTDERTFATGTILLTSGGGWGGATVVDIGSGDMDSFPHQGITVATDATTGEVVEVAYFKSSANQLTVAPALPAHFDAVVFTSIGNRRGEYSDGSGYGGGTAIDLVNPVTWEGAGYVEVIDTVTGYRCVTRLLSVYSESRLTLADALPDALNGVLMVVPLGRSLAGGYRFDGWPTQLSTDNDYSSQTSITMEEEANWCTGETRAVRVTDTYSGESYETTALQSGAATHIDLADGVPASMGSQLRFEVLARNCVTESDAAGYETETTVNTDPDAVWFGGMLAFRDEGTGEYASLECSVVAAEELTLESAVPATMENVLLIYPESGGYLSGAKE